jgi:hypothetical protein
METAFRGKFGGSMLCRPSHVLGSIEIVIPGRDEVASPESITTARGYGFRACALRRIPE